jgi:hypothetical protein
LHDSLSGNTRTILIACVAPTVLHSAESFSTLQFADRAKNVMLTIRANTLVDDNLVLVKANAEIARLKSLLINALKQTTLAGNTVDDGSGSKGNNTVKAQVNEIEKILKENEDLKKENKALKLMIKSKEAVSNLNDNNSPSQNNVVQNNANNNKQLMLYSPILQVSSARFNHSNLPPIAHQYSSASGKKKKRRNSISSLSFNAIGNNIGNKNSNEEKEEDNKLDAKSLLLYPHEQKNAINNLSDLVNNTKNNSKISAPTKKNK